MSSVFLFPSLCKQAISLYNHLNQCKFYFLYLEKVGLASQSIIHTQKTKQKSTCMLYRSLLLYLHLFTADYSFQEKHELSFWLCFTFFFLVVTLVHANLCMHILVYANLFLPDLHPVRPTPHSTFPTRLFPQVISLVTITYRGLNVHRLCFAQQVVHLNSTLSASSKGGGLHVIGNHCK